MEKTILFFEKLLYTFIGIIKILKGTRFRTKIKIRKTKGDSCYILGNGPSLNEALITDRSRLISENLIAVNHFGSSDLYAELKPHFYVLVDPAYYVVNIDQKLQTRVNSLFADLKEKTSWPMTLFIPFEGQKAIRELLKENENITIAGYNKVNTWKGFKWFDHWVYDNQWAILSGLNVIMAALYLAIIVGFKKIYLLGADHSWHKNLVVGDDNIVYEYDVHFYDKESQKPTPVVMESNNKIVYVKMHEQLGSIKKAFEIYHYIQNYAKYKNVMIYNCTPNSYIDAFERLKL